MTARVSSTRFIAREAELARLVAALSAAAAGSPATMVVSGEAGVGKTRLLSEFAAHATGAGARVLVGACMPLSGGGLPYGPIVEAFRPLVRDLEPAQLHDLLGPSWPELVRLLPIGEQPLEPPDGGSGSRSAQAHLFELALRLVDRLGSAAPLVLVVEDLHWVDRSTLDLLRFLSRSLRSERALIVVSCRTDEPREDHLPRGVLAELDRGHGSERIELARFAREELAALLEGILGSLPPAETVDRIHARSEGNPFFAEELLVGGMGEPDSRLPARLRDVALARVDALSPDAQETVRVAATAGRRVGHRLLAAASGLPEERLLPALRQAVSRHILVPAADRDAYVFRHALVQEAVYTELLPGDRMRLHAAIARSLPQGAAGGRPDVEVAAELAHHWHAAGDLPRALVASAEAGRAAACVSAYSEAHRQLERALELWDQVPDAGERTGMRHADLLEQAAEAARWAGYPDRAVALAHQVLATVDPARNPARAATLQERLGRYLWETGDSEGSLDAYDTASGLLAGEQASAERARVLAAQGAALARNARFRQSLVRSEEAIAVARSAGSRAEEGHALNTLGVDLAMTGDPDAGVAALLEARRIAEATGSFEDLSRADSNLSFVLLKAGRLEEGLDVARRGVELTRQFGVELTGGGVLLCNAADALLRLGRWRETDDLTRSALERAVPMGAGGLSLHLVRGELDIGRGAFDQAQAHLDRVVELSGRVTEPQRLGSLHACLAELEIWRADHDAARRAVTRGLALVEGGEDAGLGIRLCSLGVRAEADRAERARASRAHDQLDGIHSTGAVLLAQARDLGRQDASLPEAAIEAALCEAEFLRLEQRPDPERWASAATAWDAARRPYPAAYARWRQAEALVSAKAPRAAAVALRAAHRTALRLEAGPLLREIESLAGRGRLDLHRAAPARPRRVRAAVPPSPAERLGLTRREREVLGYVALGHTNRQIARALFITEKTASVHVSNILLKLGVANRVEAAAAAHRLELVPERQPPAP
ncbi:MAG TPA: AAA family ATPase [Actinomycetes bacterium]|nr:AAA family ATPase [Actinomycetes bacterium]